MNDFIEYLCRGLVFATAAAVMWTVGGTVVVALANDIFEAEKATQIVYLKLYSTWFGVGLLYALLRKAND